MEKSVGLDLSVARECCRLLKGRKTCRKRLLQGSVGKECRGGALEKIVGGKCCRRVLKRSGVEQCCRQVLEKNVGIIKQTNAGQETCREVVKKCEVFTLLSPRWEKSML